MASGIQKTWNVLALTRNRVAVPVLAAALGSRSAEIRAGAVRALVRRHDPSSHEPLIRQFASLGKAEQNVLQEAIREMPERLSAALSQAMLEGDARHCENACNIILLCRNFESFPLLIQAVEQRQHCHWAQAAAALLRLTNLLYQEVAEMPSSPDAPRRDPFFVRRQALAQLASSLARFHKHQRREIVEAFLVLAPADHATLLHILRDERHPCHEHFLASLRTSKSPGMMQLLAELLHAGKTPASALGIVADRADRRFLELLLGRLEQPAPLLVLQNMRRLSSVAWLEDRRAVLFELSGPAQAAAVDLAVASRVSRHAVFDLISALLHDGAAEGRRAACRALASFRRPQATALALAAAKDADPGVQAEAIKLLRTGSLPPCAWKPDDTSRALPHAAG